MRIVRVANFVTAQSGGLRTALRELGSGYRAAGHEPVLVVPGARAGDEMTPQGRVLTLPGPVLPATGGYRVLANRFRVAALLRRLAPDRLEISDRTTLRWIGPWARREGIPTVMVSHESLTGLGGMASRAAPVARLVDLANARTARDHDVIVCTTAWAAAEFRRVGATNLRRVPLGVDLDLFTPQRRAPQWRRLLAGDDEVLLVSCGRLSAEKKPDRSLDALLALRAQGVPATLVFAGDGPLRDRLARRAVGLPVHFTGFIHRRADLARLLASADVVLAPGPVETFGLAALESLACGTPVVVDGHSALPDVVGAAGAAVGNGDFAAGVRSVLDRPPGERRIRARRRAERFPWAATVAGFLAAHGITQPHTAPVTAHGGRDPVAVAA